MTVNISAKKLIVPFAFAGVLGTVSFDGGKCDVKTVCGALDGWDVTVNSSSDAVSVG
ncbi:MAG: hypothetical protein IJ037_03565 [Clostridia bacterium]|nr:hypothetical protein [Clostridia bacterium]